MSEEGPRRGDGISGAEVRVLERMAVRRFAAAALILGAVFFGTAGTLRYWEAWVYLAITLIPMALAVRYLIRTDPELLERRLKAREERATRSVLQKVGAVAWLALLLIPGLDQRFDWSSVPAIVVLAGNALVLLGYLLFVRVMQENSYASRVIEVREGQSVITTGPYAMVRHPMYLAVFVMLCAPPVALGSSWALIPAAVTPLILVFRIRDEEAMLRAAFPEYRVYAERTPYRLIPGVW
jgi:protein-S-isoprenylcysteine O-methyltransferase Ste14